MFLINLNAAEIVACAASQIWKILPNMVFPPDLGKKMPAF